MTPSPIPRQRTKDVTPEERQQIIELTEHYGSREIATRLGLSRKVIRRILSQVGMTYSKTSTNSTKLAPFLAQVAEKEAARLTVSRILREIRTLGYTGGRTILAEHVRGLRSQRPLTRRRQAKRRFETMVGAEMQADWSPVTVMIAGKPTLVHVLGIVLAHSRKLFYGVYRNERQTTLLDALVAGFEYFRGCSFRVVFDNMSTVVLGRIGHDRKPLWHSRFLDFARHYGFEPYLCAVADPDRKGKKEKSFRLIQDDFLKGTDFDSWEDLSSRLRQWLDHTPGVGNLRVHGTTGRVPNEAYLTEQPLLIPLPSHRFSVFDEVIRAVDQDSTLSINGIRYSVPAVLACRHVPVRLFAEHFEAFDTRGRLMLSQRYLDRAIHPGRLVIDSSHYAGLPRRPRNGADAGRLDQAFLRRFPTLDPLVNGLKKTMKSIAGIHLRGLLRLAETYGQDAFLDAATRAQQHHRFDAHAVKRILERDHPLPPDEPTPSLDGIGPTLLGDVEEGSLDTFASLDQKPHQEADNGPK